MKRHKPDTARQLDPILRELYAAKASLNRKARFDIKVLCDQVRKEADSRTRTPRRAA